MKINDSEPAGNNDAKPRNSSQSWNDSDSGEYQAEAPLDFLQPVKISALNHKPLAFVAPGSLVGTLQPNPQVQVSNAINKLPNSSTDGSASEFMDLLFDKGAPASFRKSDWGFYDSPWLNMSALRSRDQHTAASGGVNKAGSQEPQSIQPLFDFQNSDSHRVVHHLLTPRDRFVLPDPDVGTQDTEHNFNWIFESQIQEFSTEEAPQGTIPNSATRAVTVIHKQPEQLVGELGKRRVLKVQAAEPVQKETEEQFMNMRRLLGLVCNCARSGCSKLYCECFRSGMCCSRLCGCLACANPKRDLGRDRLQSRLQATRAMKGKTMKGKSGVAGKSAVLGKPCNCQRSGCLKMYCACRSIGQVCSAECSCKGCSNPAQVQQPVNTKHLHTGTEGVSETTAEEDTLRCNSEVRVVGGQNPQEQGRPATESVSRGFLGVPRGKPGFKLVQYRL